MRNMEFFTKQKKRTTLKSNVTESIVLHKTYYFYNTLVADEELSIPLLTLYKWIYNRLKCRSILYFLLLRGVKVFSTRNVFPNWPSKYNRSTKILC